MVGDILKFLKTATIFPNNNSLYENKIYNLYMAVVQWIHKAMFLKIPSKRENHGEKKIQDPWTLYPKTA